MHIKKWIEGEQAMQDFGGLLAQSCEFPLVIYLQGPLGAGKTTLARGFIRALGVDGSIKSPSYSILEDYSLEKRRVFHLDLYRVVDPAELEFLGFEPGNEDCVLVEWPEHGAKMLLPADLSITIEYAEDRRCLQFQSLSEVGYRVLMRLA